MADVTVQFFYPHALNMEYILCTINLAIVLYGCAHPHQISSFICCHEGTRADHLTRYSINKNTELPNAAAVPK